MNGGRVNVTIGGNTLGVGALVSTGTATLVGGNNITLSQNGNAITISGGAAGGGSHTLGMSNLGNTSGISGIISGSALQFAFAGGNNVTLSQSINASSGTITISAASQTVQTQNLHNVSLGGNTAGVMAQVSSGTLSLVGGNNITLSQNGNAVTISGGAGGGGGVALANSQTVYSSGTANLMVAGGAMTIASTTGQSFNFSVPQTSSMTATGAVSISTNGSTISIGAPAFSAGISNIGNTLGTSGTASNQVVFAGGSNVTLSQATGAGGNTITISAGGGAALSRFEYIEGFFTSLSNISQGSLSLNHMYVPFNVTGTAAKIGGSLSAATNTGATTASVNMSLWMGIYSLNGSTLSLASSGSANNGFQWSQSASSTANTSVNSMRQMTVPMNVNMTPGEYWVAAVISSATTYTSVGYTIFGNNQIASAATGAVLTPIGSNTTANRDAMLFQGVYTAATSAGPVSIVGSQINNTSVGLVQRANFYNAIYNATY